MASNIYSEVIITRGNGDTDGNPTIVINFAGCYVEVYGTELTDKEIELFKTGVLAEGERVWERLADILDSETLEKIKYEELFKVKGEG